MRRIILSMPHIRIRSLSQDQVQALSLDLARELAPVMGTSEDNFTIEKVDTQFFQNGKVAIADPLIEVLWFERGQEVQDQSAKKITELVQKIENFPYICVVFTALPKTSYYENGRHF